MLDIVVKKGGNLDNIFGVVKRTDDINVVWLDDYGWNYISSPTKMHNIHIRDAFGLANDNVAVRDFIMDAAKTGVKDPTDPYRIVKYYPEKNKNLRVITKELSDSTIKDAYPA